MEFSLCLSIRWGIQDGWVLTIDGDNNRGIKTIDGCQELAQVVRAQWEHLKFSKLKGVGSLVDKSLILSRVKLKYSNNGYWWDLKHYPQKLSRQIFQYTQRLDSGLKKH